MELLKSKIIIILALFGAGLAFILGLISRVDLFALFFRSILGALLMGAIGLGLELFLKQTLPADDYNNILSALGDSRAGNTANSAGAKLDILDTDNHDADAYAELYDTAEAKSEKPSFTPKNPDPEPDATPAYFREESFDDVPRVTAVNDDNDAPADEYRQPAIQDDLNNIKQAHKDETNKQKSFSGTGPGGDIKFRVGNKNISADSKLIAKAIQTVLHRD